MARNRWSGGDWLRDSKSKGSRWHEVIHLRKDGLPHMNIDPQTGVALPLSMEHVNLGRTMSRGGVEIIDENSDHRARGLIVRAGTVEWISKRLSGARLRPMDRDYALNLILQFFAQRRLFTHEFGASPDPDLIPSIAEVFILGSSRFECSPLGRVLILPLPASEFLSAGHYQMGSLYRPSEPRRDSQRGRAPQVY